MSEIETIEVTKRESVGKGPARAARRAGAIPCVVYGLGETPLSIAIDELVLRRLVGMPSFFSQLFSLNVDGTKMNVLARDVQVHPVSDRPMHVDFLRVDADAAISVEVPALFINEDTCPGLLDGGILNVVRHTIEVSCRPDAIPEQIKVDLSTAQLGDSIHISSVSLPEGVVPTITDRDFTIATIAAPSVSKATDDDEDGGDAEGDAATAEGGEGESS